MIYGNVGLFGCILRHALMPHPGFIFSLSCQISYTRFSNVAVTGGSLFVETIKFQKFIIGWLLGEGFGFFTGGIELKFSRKKLTFLNFVVIQNCETYIHFFQEYFLASQSLFWRWSMRTDGVLLNTLAFYTQYLCG